MMQMHATSVRMHSEGYSSYHVCLSVTQHLTGMNRPTNNTTYSASDKRRKICRIFSETTAFESHGVKTK